MSASLLAAMVIGYQVPESEVLQAKAVRGCQHLEMEGAKFCPECGKAMWVHSDEPVLEEGEAVEGFEVVVIPSAYENRPRRYYVGHISRDNWSIRELAAYDFNMHRESLQKVLKALGIDPGKCKFGLHLAAGISY